MLQVQTWRDRPLPSCEQIWQRGFQSSNFHHSSDRPLQVHLPRASRHTLNTSYTCAFFHPYAHSPVPVTPYSSARPYHPCLLRRHTTTSPQHYASSSSPPSHRLPQSLHHVCATLNRLTSHRRKLRPPFCDTQHYVNVNISSPSSCPHRLLFERQHDRPHPHNLPPHSILGMQCAPQANEDASRDRLHGLKRSIPSQLGPNSTRASVASLDEHQCTNLDPSAILRLSSTDNFHRMSRAASTLAGKQVVAPCPSMLVNHPDGNSRASSSSFSSMSFSSSVTSSSSLSDADKNFLFYPDDPTNCEQLEHAIHAEALSPPPTDPMPSLGAEKISDIVPPIPSNIAQQKSPSSNPRRAYKTPASRDSARPAVAVDESSHNPNRPAPVCSPPLQSVSASEFSDALLSFTALKLSQLSETEVYEHVRHLLDLLDVLIDKIPLPVNERLFTALAEPKILMALVDLMQDVSVASAPRPTFEALKQFRYPYVVGTILAGPKLADACLAYPALLDKIITILDVSKGRTKTHPVVVAHTVNVLVTYLEYSPEPLLDRLEARPTFMPALVGQLSMGSIVELISSLLPSRCVDAVGNMDPAAATFDSALEIALQFLAKAQCFHLLTAAYSEAADHAADAYSASFLEGEARTPDSSMDLKHIPSGFANASEDCKSAVFNAEQVAFNCVACYKRLIELTVRVVRIDTRSLACIYLNAFGSPSTSKTLGQILDAGIHVYSKTQGNVVNFLITSITLATEVLKVAEADSVKRVASVAGQPSPLGVSAITKEIMSRLVPLTLIATGRFLDEKTVEVPARIRMHVLEFMATCQRVCSPEVFSMLDQLRFGEVAFKMLLLHQKHSMIHTTVVRAVESALLADTASLASRRHWLVNSRLTEKIIRAWRKEHGSERWGKPKVVQHTPFLSAIVHIACCVHHWIAYCHANTQPGERGIARELIGDSLMDSFNRFFAENLQSIVADEKRPLGGERPSRIVPGGRNGRLMGSLGSLRRSGSMSDDGNNPWSSSQNGVHLVRSISAHRFGFMEPAAPRARSHFADIFDCNGIDDDNGNDFGLTLFDMVGFVQARQSASGQNAATQNGGGDCTGGGLRKSSSHSSLVRSTPVGETVDSLGADPFE